MIMAGRLQQLCHAALALAACGALTPARAEWQPTQPITFVVPAGAGGGADQMAREIKALVDKNKLAAPAIEVINEAGGAGPQGLLDPKGGKSKPPKNLLTHSHPLTP